MSLIAPFPWYGGKRRHAEMVWKYFGDISVYVEPFAGSLAVLLYKAIAISREVVCDTDGGICNFWRAITHDPEQVAYWADYPSIHQDLRARHIWLIQWVIDNKKNLEENPEYFDAKAAGWWVWGISLWIGGGWCQPDYRYNDNDQNSGGMGISAQRKSVSDRRPQIQPTAGGMGISAQTGKSVTDRRPFIQPHSGGNVVSAQSHSILREDLVDYFFALASRLKRVVVLNRSWESALTPSILQHTSTGPKPAVGVFLDPPYLMEERSKDIYSSDSQGTSDDVARASWEWAKKHGNTYRIVYCCHEGDFDVPPGWAKETKAFAAILKDERRHRRDCMLFSPKCLKKVENMSLF